jgi:hypothetical protein
MTTVGIRTGHFAQAVRFLTEVLDLTTVHLDTGKQYASFRLRSGQLLEVLGTDSMWQPFTTPPEWELIIADIRQASPKGS